jgi:hypothetical protein
MSYYTMINSKKIRKNRVNIKIQDDVHTNENSLNKEKRILKWNNDYIIIQQDLGHMYGSW